MTIIKTKINKISNVKKKRKKYVKTIHPHTYFKGFIIGTYTRYILTGTIIKVM